MSVETFLGFKKMIVPSKGSRERQPRDLILSLFLAVFACAYVYFPYSETVSKKCRREPTRDILFSTPPEPILMSPKKRNKVAPFRIVNEKKKLHYLDEPLCQLVAKARTQRLNSRRILWNSEKEVLKGHQNRNENTEDKAVKQGKHDPEDRTMSNPNTNHWPAAQQKLKNPNMQAPLNKETVNPNSVVIVNNLSDPQHLNEEEKGEIDSGPLTEVKIIQIQQQQKALYMAEITSLYNKSVLLKTSILDSQERICELYDSNQKLMADVMDRDALLQEKDDLIMGIQMQLMNYESVLGNTPDGDFIHEDVCISELRNEHRRDLNQLKKEWMIKEFQQEKRINSLLTALKFERERARVLQSPVFEGQYSKTHDKDWSKASGYVEEDPGKQVSPHPIPSDITFSSNQQTQIESRMSRSSATSGVDIEMLDDSVEYLADSELGKPVTELELLRKRNFELESQINQSCKAIGELNGEVRELECLNKKLSSQLDQEPGRTMVENTNTRSTQTQPGQREWRTQFKPRSLFNVPKFLSCRKAGSEERFNTLEISPDRQRILISQV